MQIWKIYSYWGFAMTALWYAGVLKFSPLLSVIFTLIGGVIFSFFQYKGIKPVNLLIFITHLIPVILLRHTSVDIKENVGVFILYNLVLLASGTTAEKVYSDIFKNPPRTVREYFLQRGLKGGGSV
jgi:hypothetical protein